MPRTFRATTQADTSQTRCTEVTVLLGRRLLTRRQSECEFETKQGSDVHINSLGLRLLLIARLAAIALLVGLLRLLRVVPALRRTSYLIPFLDLDKRRYWCIESEPAGG